MIGIGSRGHLRDLTLQIVSKKRPTDSINKVVSDDIDIVVFVFSTEMWTQLSTAVKKLKKKKDCFDVDHCQRGWKGSNCTDVASLRLLIYHLCRDAGLEVSECNCSILAMEAGWLME